MNEATRLPSPAGDRFEPLFVRADDPWCFATSWYEARKRALTLACLPQERFVHGFEPGCANGVLTEALAPRCRQLTGWDAAPTAVARARTRLADHPHVRIETGTVPRGWPPGRFDLIVISELAYYLTESEIDHLAARIDASLTGSATVVACHWRWPIEESSLDADAVHARLARGLQLPRLCAVRERDFRIDVWSRDPRSMAEREGIVASGSDRATDPDPGDC